MDRGSFQLGTVTYKVDVPNLIAYHNQTPIFEWNVTRCGFKNMYQGDICIKQIGPFTHNMITIIVSIFRAVLYI